MSVLTDSNAPLIEYRNVTVCRGQREVLRGLNLSIGAGVHVTIAMHIGIDFPGQA